MGRICGEELCQLTLVSLPFAEVRHPEESNCREGGFIQLTVPGYSPSLRVRQGEKNRTQLLPATVSCREQRIHACVLVCSSISLFPTKCPAQERVPPTEAGSFCLINIIKNSLPLMVHVHRPTKPRQSCTEPLFAADSRLSNRQLKSVINQLQDAACSRASELP